LPAITPAPTEECRLRVFEKHECGRKRLELRGSSGFRVGEIRVE
jgi:hypothetical protein